MKSKKKKIKEQAKQLNEGYTDNIELNIRPGWSQNEDVKAKESRLR